MRPGPSAPFTWAHPHSKEHTWEAEGHSAETLPGTSPGSPPSESSKNPPTKGLRAGSLERAHAPPPPPFSPKLQGSHKVCSQGSSGQRRLVPR